MTSESSPAHPRPRLLVSECLEFKPVRWNAQMMRSDAVRLLKPHVDFFPACPEVGVGLGVPRETVRLVELDGSVRLVQPATGRDLTGDMVALARNTIAGLPALDGAIFKAESPSSALRDAKIYPSIDAASSVRRGPGMFTREVLALLPGLPAEDDGRLNNPVIRDTFFRAIFTRARFRVAKDTGSLDALVRFHRTSKFLLKSFDEQRAGVLGRIVAGARSHAIGDALARYEHVLLELLRGHPACGANVNVFLHLFGFFSGSLAREENAFFLDQLDKYRRGSVPRGTVTALLRSWVIRFDVAYLKDQTVLDPYPAALQDLDVHAMERAGMVSGSP